MGDSEWCDQCDASPCECYCRTCGNNTLGEACWECAQTLSDPVEREDEIDSMLGRKPSSAADQLDEKGDDIPRAIREECDAICELLQAKNKAYGNSALEPIGIFGSKSSLDLIATRADDKLSRIKNMGGLVHCLADTESEDTVRDLIGYLILARIAAKRDN